MNEAAWQEVLNRLEIRHPPCRPAADDHIRRYEEETGFILPDSYKSFCRVFGPGMFELELDVAVPFYGKHRQHSEFFVLQETDRIWHNETEFTEYCTDPERYARATFFASGYREYFCWDPQHITNAVEHEYGIYFVRRNYEMGFAVATFEEFICDLCLGKKHEEFFCVEPEQVFMPCDPAAR